MTCQATSSKLREVLRSDTIGVLGVGGGSGPHDLDTIGYEAHLEGEATSPQVSGTYLTPWLRIPRIQVLGWSSYSRLGFLGKAIGSGGCEIISVCFLFLAPKIWGWDDDSQFGGRLSKKYQLVYVNAEKRGKNILNMRKIDLPKSHGKKHMKFHSLWKTSLDQFFSWNFRNTFGFPKGLIPPKGPQTTQKWIIITPISFIQWSTFYM